MEIGESKLESIKMREHLWYSENVNTIGREFVDKRLAPLANKTLEISKKFSTPVATVLLGILISTQSQAKAVSPGMIASGISKDWKSAPQEELSEIFVSPDAPDLPEALDTSTPPDRLFRKATLLPNSKAFAASGAEVGQASSPSAGLAPGLEFRDYRGDVLLSSSKVFLVSSMENSLVDPLSPIENQQLKVGEISKQINEGKLVAAGRIINEDKSWDIVPFYQIVDWERNSDNVLVATVRGNGNKIFQFSAADVLISLPVADGGFSLNDPKANDLRSLYWYDKSSFSRAIKEAAKLSLGTESKYEELLRYKYNESRKKTDDETEVWMVDKTTLANDVANHILNVELNEPLQSMAQRIESEGGRDAYNTYVRNTLRGEDFKSGQVPQFTANAFKDFVILSYQGLGGGVSTDPVILMGAYADRGYVIDNLKRTEQFFLHDISHEKWHAVVQRNSKESSNSMVFSRDGYTNWSDPYTQLTHASMGIPETVMALRLGVEGVYPNYFAIFVADKLLRSGLSPEQAVTMITNVAAHGDIGAKLETFYNRSKLAEEPTLKEILLDQKSIRDYSIDPQTPDKILNAMGNLAGISKQIPSYDPIKDIFSSPYLSPVVLTKTSSFSK